MPISDIQANALALVGDTYPPRRDAAGVLTQRNGPAGGGRFRLYADLDGELRSVPLDTPAAKQEIRHYTSFTDQDDYTRVAAPFGMPADPSGSTEVLRFERAADASLGRLWMDKDGKFHFEGDADASALIFFEVLKNLCEANRKD
jgi:hypothetical protein